MSNLWRAGICVALVAFATSTALAQQGRGGQGGLHTLVANKSVQEELKLTDDQKTKVEELGKKTAETLTEKTKDLSADDRRAKMPAIMKEINEATTKSLGSILKDDQTKRLMQIHLQQQSYRAFNSAATQKELKLTEEQTKEVKSMIEEAGKKFQEDTKDLTRQDAAKRREITQKINKETMEKISGKLTDEQKKAWKEMIGTPFEVKPDRPQQ